MLLLVTEIDWVALFSVTLKAELLAPATAIARVPVKQEVFRETNLKGSITWRCF